MVSLDALERAEQGDGVGRIERGEGTGAALRLSNLSVTLDNGTAVVKDAEVDIAPGERVLVAGESGTGKSTLVRAIAGLVAVGRGQCPGRVRRENVPDAAARLRSGRHLAQGRDLSRAGGSQGRR